MLHYCSKQPMEFKIEKQTNFLMKDRMPEGWKTFSDIQRIRGHYSYKLRKTLGGR